VPRASAAGPAELSSRAGGAAGVFAEKARLAEWGATALPGSPADFGKHIAEEIEKWGKVIRAANIKVE